MRGSLIFAAASLLATQSQAAIIFDQLGDFGGGYYQSQDFEAGFDQFDSYVLENFDLTEKTKLTSISVGGVGFAGMTDLSNVQHWQVAFWSGVGFISSGDGDTANVIIAPNDAVVTASLSPFAPSWTITLPIDFTLQAGNWFFGVRPRLNFDGGGQFGVGIFGAPGLSVFANPGQGFGLGNSFLLGGDAAYRLEGTAIAGIPEPASWAMLIAGFGLVGATVRRRRQVAATA